VITLDHRPKCLHANPRSGSASSPEIHVHLKGLGDALRFGSSVLGNRENTSMISPKENTVVSHDFGHPPTSDLCSPQLSDILDALEKSQPGSNFTEMLTPLQEAGVHTLDEVLLRGEAMLVEWTGLPLHQVTALCNYSDSETLYVGKPALLEEPTSDTTTGNDDTDEGEGGAEDED
jgi:hypothetical protein